MRNIPKSWERNCRRDRFGRLYVPAGVFRNIKEVYRCTIRGKLWTIIQCKMPPHHLGCTMSYYGNTKRVIFVERSQPPWQLMDTLVHECLHAYFDRDMTEKTVKRCATDCVRALRLLFNVRGWVRKPPKKRKAR